jgi:hypothetical protein
MIFSGVAFKLEYNYGAKTFDPVGLPLILPIIQTYLIIRCFQMGNGSK